MHKFTPWIFVALLAVAPIGAALAIGAIAVDDYYDEDPSEAGYGIATEYLTTREASAAALDACKSEQNSDCKVVLTFKKWVPMRPRRAAMALDRRTHAKRPRSARSVNAATQIALSLCLIVTSDRES